MKIRINQRRRGFTVYIDRQPLPENRFKAVCAIVSAGVYCSMVIAVAALCGLPGVITIGVGTVLCLMIVTVGAI